MSNKSVLLFACASLLCATFGCGGWGGGTNWPDLSIIGAGEGHVFLEYCDTCDGWDDHDNTLWVLDTATNEASRLLTYTYGQSPQGDGDYYAAEQVLDERTKQQIVAGSIHRDRPVVVYETDLDPEEYYSRGIIHALSDQLLAVRTKTDLMIYDIEAESVVKRIAVPETFVEMVLFDGTRAVLAEDIFTGDTANAILVDVATEEISQLPLAPEGYTPFYLAFFVFTDGNQLVTDMLPNDTPGLPTMEIWSLDLTTLQWARLASFSESGSRPAQAGRWALHSLSGFESGRALVWTWRPYALVGECVVELLDTETGELSSVASYADPAMGFPMNLFSVKPIIHPILRDGRVYWVNPLEWQTLIVQDVETGQRRTLDLTGVWQP
jgi:hypothetical protein